MGAELVIYLLRRLRPREGWIATLYLVVAAICLPWSVMTAEWLPGSGALLPITLVALPVGLWAGRGRRAGLRLASVAVVGVLSIGLWLIGAFPSVRALTGVVIQTVTWLNNGRVGE